ncbi:fimbrial biogenesis outer membrane usher protein [Parablastomonas sp. CN1-191]|uniref:fimbrial biogenesis outer membrane usher protein n=1 Tax=Parablastomonas sp. CN1-191 TaxID=3400908 RepID=UPI003BF8E7DC
MARGGAYLRSGAAALVLLGTPALAQPGGVTQPLERRITLERAPGDAAGRLNPGKRTVVLTVPARDGAAYLGDIAVTIDTQDKVSFPADRLLDILASVVSADVLRTLRGSFPGDQAIPADAFARAGIQIRYNPQELALDLVIASERRASRALQVTPLDRERVGTFVVPATVSAYVNIRANLDYLYGDGGFQSPTMYLDGAARVLGTVFQSEAIWQPGAAGARFQRLGSRAVFDDQNHVIRFTAGDLEPVGRGFQGGPQLAGVSLFRSYSTLQPQTIARPRGGRTFRLDRPATVEVQVNGQVVRRLRLDPGNYDLRDFPFAQGANDVRLSILDDAGRSEMVRFNVFLDQSQLGKGLAEFGLYAGVNALTGASGLRYSGDGAVTGYIRRGISEALTLGANGQGDGRSRMAGVEAVWSTGFGTFGANLSGSNIKDYGWGSATLITFQRLIQRGGGQADALNLFAERRSAQFGVLGTRLPSNPFAWEAGGGYSHAFSDRLYGGLDGRFSRGRGGQRDFSNARGTLGWRAGDRINLTGDVRWQRDSLGRGISALFSATLRLGAYSNARADYDTRFNRTQLSYNTLRGQGIGAYNVTADVEHSDFGSGVNVAGNLYTNRAELGLSHFGTFENVFGRSLGQRTTLRAASSLAFADGAFSIGRPIYDSFAIVRGHRSLKGASIDVDPSAVGTTARTGILGTAIQPGLSAYSERTIAVDVPAAPSGVDLGQGSFRLYPPYRSGYVLQVGSQYGVTAIGRLVNRDGDPIALMTGTATELAHPDRAPVSVFTNRDGRFGAAGLAPGKWRIDMVDDLRSSFILDVPAATEGVLRTGDLKPSTGDSKR